MAHLPRVKNKLSVQIPVVKKERDMAFYVVPPLLLAAVFAFCAYFPRDVKPQKQATAATAAATAPAKPAASKAPAAPQQRGVPMADPNSSLPEYAMPQGCKNLLAGAKSVTASSPAKDSPADKAVDGSCANDGHVAVAQPAGDEPAWWQVETDEGLSGESIVIYGGGSKSPAGKLEGGFRVDVEYASGETQSREYCKPGFALEGYESMKLEGSEAVKRIRVTALRPNTPIVLREVQLIGSAN